MAKLTHLLAATDFSAPARRAAERAALIARKTGATLDLVHVASLAPVGELRRLVAELPIELEQRLLDKAREEIRELAAMLLKRFDVAATVHIVSGPLLLGLANQAAATSADLIILGVRGASFMRHLLLGSTAERMISKSSRPMLVVKEGAHESYRSLLVPVDFSPSSLRAISDARAIAPGAAIILLHAFEVPFEGKMRFAGIEEDTIQHYRAAAKQEAQQKLLALSEEAGMSQYDARLIALHGDPSRNIIEQEQEHDCDLIVMGKHGDNMVEELLLGSVTRRVLTESQCDVLVST